MAVYADILVILNTLTDWFLILAAAKLLNKKPRLWRMLLSATVGGFSSLYIFAPDYGTAASLIYKATVCFLTVGICFGFGGIKSYLRSVLVFSLVTFGYGGIMTAVYGIFKPKGMAVANSVVYINISPAVLIFSSVGAYLIFTVLSMIFGRSSKLAEACEITVTADGKSLNLSGITDTGNSLNDILSGNEVIIADKSVLKGLFGSLDISEDEKIKARYRIIPCTTVSGYSSLDGYRCDMASVKNGSQIVTLKSPILAVSKTPLNDGYNAIINPKIFL